MLNLVLSVFFLSDVNAQSNKKLQKWFDEAKQNYRQNNMPEAINLCDKILKSNPGFVNASLLLADLYNDIDSTELEIVSLEMALPFTENTIVLYRLGEANYSLGKYEKALHNFNKYSNSNLASEKLKKEAQHKIKNCEFALEAIQNPVEFNPKKLSDSINSGHDEYWPSLSLDKQTLVFTRLLKPEGRIPQEDFFIAEFDSTDWAKANPIIEINSSLNEGAQTLSADGKLMFFTACNRSDGAGSCDIYYSRLIGEKWTAPQNAGKEVNSKYWEAQPSFSSDNKYLYFSSNRLNGKGKKDIWRTEFLGFDESGEIKFGKPENMGNEVNTEGDEISPFIHPNNRNLYFASNFHVGMGGFDLYNAEINFEGSIQKPVNLGYPINTFKDEQGLVISSDGETAYFASTRGGDTGLDICSFSIDEGMRPDPVSYVKAKVIDAETAQPISAKIELIRLGANELERRMESADHKGELLLCLPLDANYAFNVSEEGYLFYSQSFQLENVETLVDPFEVEINLQPVKLGAEMNLYNIYFETDSFRILPQSEPELNKLVTFLNNNLELEIEIQGHTDNSGNETQNQILSEQRAQSVLEYLIAKGIDQLRMKSKGFGETDPVASNERLEGKKLNRRTTIKITGYKQ
ncbi:MAG: OmpA family protein [Pseudomonadales bacterium]|nr:OmpA family protein [Pseudomonadales bacterium]